MDAMTAAERSAAFGVSIVTVLDQLPADYLAALRAGAEQQMPQPGRSVPSPRVYDLIEYGSPPAPGRAVRPPAGTGGPPHLRGVVVAVGRVTPHVVGRPGGRSAGWSEPGGLARMTAADLRRADARLGSLRQRG